MKQIYNELFNKVVIQDEKTGIVYEKISKTIIEDGIPDYKSVSYHMRKSRYSYQFDLTDDDGKLEEMFNEKSI